MKSPAHRLGKSYSGALLEGLPALRLRAVVLLALSAHICEVLKWEKARLMSSRLKALAGDTPCPERCRALLPQFAEIEGKDRYLSAARLLGRTLDLLQASESGGERKKTGSYFTPHTVAEDLLERALRSSAYLDVSRPVTVCDPACGGGAFLVEAAHLLAERRGNFQEVCSRIHGVDLSPVALATTEVALWFLARDDSLQVGDPQRFVVGDALFGASFTRDCPDDENLTSAEGDVARLDFPLAFPELRERGFDWVVGNPPWVAFQGRATQKLSPERRAFYRRHFAAFSGYPTLHGLFIQRAAELAPKGVITLLVPSSVSDLDGYRQTRCILRSTHTAREPLPEYGQDAFQGVVQPCFGLVAEPVVDTISPPDGPFALEEKTHATSQVARIAPPSILQSLEALSPLPRETFREMGFQSNRVVAETLFHRGDAPKEPFSVPLLEGRNVGEFVEREARLFLWPDEKTLTATNCRLKSVESYRSVSAVVRQTAAFTIAARHDGRGFRNSLIGAFETPEVSVDLLVGLLNSALYRALHIARQRDARQAAFPQVKVAHLRRLPMPPNDADLRERVARLSRAASAAGGLNAEMRMELDGAVLELFSVRAHDGDEIRRFLAERAPAAVRSSRT